MGVFEWTSFGACGYGARFGSVIFDPPSNRVISALPDRHGYLQRDVGWSVNPGLFGLSAKMQFSRRGNATIAGQPWSDWSVFKRHRRGWNGVRDRRWRNSKGYTRKANARIDRGNSCAFMGLLSPAYSRRPRLTP